MSVINSLGFARRVIGLAGAGIVPSAEVVSTARDCLADANVVGLVLQKADQALQRLQMGVLPSMTACREAATEVGESLMRQQSFLLDQGQEQMASGFYRPRDR